MSCSIWQLVSPVVLSAGEIAVLAALVPFHQQSQLSACLKNLTFAPNKALSLVRQNAKAVGQTSCSSGNLEGYVSDQRDTENVDITSRAFWKRKMITTPIRCDTRKYGDSTGLVAICWGSTANPTTPTTQKCVSIPGTGAPVIAPPPCMVCTYPVRQMYATEQHEQDALPPNRPHSGKTTFVPPPPNLGRSWRAEHSPLPAVPGSSPSRLILMLTLTWACPAR